jgi:hypothetical protein
MTSWPTETTDQVDPIPFRDGLVESLDFLLWLATGHIRHYWPAPVTRNGIASRCWPAPPITQRRSRSVTTRLGKLP